MASEMVIQRQKTAAAFRAALAAFDGEVTPALGERIAAFLQPGEAAFDFRQLQATLERMIAASLQALIDADKAHIDELAGDVAGRDRRDRAVEALRRKLVEARAIVKGLFGAERAAEIVAIAGRTALQPELLWRQGDHTLDRLRDPELRLPEATTAAVGFDPKALGDELKPLVTTLREDIDAVELDRRQAATTLAAKKAAMAEHDQLMGACGRTLTGLYLLAGRGDLARRVRVTQPRRKSAAPTQPQQGDADDDSSHVEAPTSTQSDATAHEPLQDLKRFPTRSADHRAPPPGPPGGNSALGDQHDKVKTRPFAGYSPHVDEAIHFVHGISKHEVPHVEHRHLIAGAAVEITDSLPTNPRATLSQGLLDA